MTTRALVKDHPWSTEKARAGTLGLAVAAEASAGPWRVQVVPEPLVRAGRAGRDTPQRAVRLIVSGPDAPPPSSVAVRVAGAGEVPVDVTPGPGGSTRLFLPHVDQTQDVEFAVALGGEHVVLRAALPPAREWTIHLVHHSHLDIGYTDPQGLVLGEHVAFLDSCLDLTRRTEDWPEEARFRWAVESLWSFEQWMAARPADRVAEFVERVRAGQIELTAMPFNLHTDTCSTDELHELLRPARRLMDQFGLTFRSAMQTDVPGTVAGLPDALSQVGVRYLSVAHNWAGRSVPHLNGGQRLPRLFRWRSPGGNEVLVWMTDSPHGLAYMEGPVLGFDTSFEMVDDLLPAYLTSLATRPYPFPPGMFGWHGPAVEDRQPYPWDVLHLRVQGHFGDNAPPRLIMSETVRRWNDTWLWPRLRLSTNADFFTDAEDRIGDGIETFTGDWGDWWVEGVGSGARPQAMVRQAQATLQSGQTLYGLAAATPSAPARADLSAAARAEADGVYRSISLFNEHTWGASNPWTHGDSGMDSGEQQWHWKYGHALAGLDGADILLDHARAALGAALPQAEHGLTYWAVNPTAVARTSPVELFVPESRVALEDTLSALDGRSGKTLAARTSDQVNATHRSAGRFLTVAAPDVPPLGAVPIVVTATPPAEGAASGAASSTSELGMVSAVATGSGGTDGIAPDDAGATVLENAHLRVRVDLRRACIASIVERASGRELVNPDAVVGFNGYVYDTYTTAGGYNHQSNKTVASPELELLGSRTLARPAAVLERVDDDVEQRLTYEYAADGVRWVRVTLRLGHDSATLVIDNRFDKPETMTKESAYLSFPFAMDQPQVRYEITGSVTGADLPHVPGAPQHMRAVRSWVSLVDAAGPLAWVTRDAPLVEPEVIALPYAPFPDSTAPREPGTVWSWVHNNIWDTNFPSAQGFAATFRYAVGVRRTDDGSALTPAALALRTAADVDQPLVGVAAAGPIGDLDERNLLSIDDERVRALSVTPHGERRLLVRLQSFADEPTSITVRYGVPVVGAWTATLLGDTVDDLDVRDNATIMRIPGLGSTALLIDLGQ